MHLLLSAFLFSTPLILAQLVDPYPVSDCTQGIGFGYASCPNQPGCCSGGAICCAGGCCPITATCVNVGTSNEGCCPLGDPDNCGAAVPSYSKPACTSGFNPKPSVSCTSADDDWYCPPSSACGTTYGACYDFFDLGCNSGAADNTAAPSATSYSYYSSAYDSSDSYYSSDYSASTVGSGSGSTTRSEVASASPSGKVAGFGQGGVGNVNRPGWGWVAGLGAFLGLVW